MSTGDHLHCKLRCILEPWCAWILPEPAYLFRALWIHLLFDGLGGVHLEFGFHFCKSPRVARCAHDCIYVRESLFIIACKKGGPDVKGQVIPEVCNLFGRGEGFHPEKPLRRQNLCFTTGTTPLYFLSFQSFAKIHSAIGQKHSRCGTSRPEVSFSAPVSRPLETPKRERVTLFRSVNRPLTIQREQDVHWV